MSQRIRERSEDSGVGCRIVPGPHPARAPKVGQRFPAECIAQSVDPAFLFVDDGGSVVVGLREPRSLFDRTCQRRLEIRVREQRRPVIGRQPAPRSWRLPRDVDG
jgi:hypothetical protein